MNSKSEILSILSRAIALEKEGLRSYLDFARATKDVGGKNMFILLARDEFDHMTIIEKISEEFSEKGQLPIFPIKSSAFREIMPRLKDIEYHTKGEEGINQIHALEMAIKFESRTRDLYGEMANRCSNEDARSMFTELMEIEQAHYDILSAQKNSISDTGLWIEIAELGMEPLV